MPETCYRHPNRETAVSCSSCGRPICPDCMTPTPVGMRCPECANQRTRVVRNPTGTATLNLFAHSLAVLGTPVTNGACPDSATAITAIAALHAGDLSRARKVLRRSLETDTDSSPSRNRHRLLLAWTSAINLTAIRDPARVALGLVVDSLTALEVVRERSIDRFVDLGSGGGYPGLPLAAALPARRALLLEPIAKKSRFLSVAIDAAGLAGTVEAASVRAEALASDARHRGRWQAVTARAVASLPALVGAERPFEQLRQPLP